MSAPIPMPFFPAYHKAGYLKKQAYEAGHPGAVFKETVLDNLATPPPLGVAAEAKDLSRSTTPPTPDPNLHGWG